MRNPHYDMIVEWAATGKAVEISTGKGWIDIYRPTWDPNCKYRFKPTMKFRNFIIERDGHFITRVTYEPENQTRIERYKNFVKWIGDWQEVEV